MKKMTFRKKDWEEIASRLVGSYPVLAQMFQEILKGKDQDPLAIVTFHLTPEEENHVMRVSTEIREVE